MKNLYDTDFYAWTQEQAEILEKKQYDLLDYKNIIEEIKSMGKSEKNELMNRLTILLSHLLKWQFQSEYQCHSWKCTIIEERKRIKDHIEDNPSLKKDILNIMDKAYSYAIIDASKETRLSLSTFPENCPYSYDQSVSENFLP